MERNTTRIGWALVALIILAVILFINKENFNEKNFSKTINITNPINIASDTNNDRIIIDNSMKRIIKLNNENTVEFSMTGGKRNSKSFYYVSDAVFGENGDIYLLAFDYFIATDYIREQKIMKYSREGNYIKTIYSIKYPEKDRLANGRILNLKYYSRKLSYIFRENNKYSINEINTENDKLELIKSFSYNNPQENIIDFDFTYDYKNIVYLTKKGEVWLQENELKMITSDKKVTGIFVPIKIKIDDQKNIYILNSGNGQIIKTDENFERTKILIFDENQIIYSFCEQNEIITAISDKNIIVSINGSEMYVDTQKLSIGIKFLLERIVAWICLLLFILIMIYFVVLVYRQFFKEKITQVFLQSIAIIVIIVISASIILSFMSNSYTEKYKNDLIAHLKLVAYLSKDNVDANAIKLINKRSDYMNENYTKMYRQVHKIFNNSKDDWNDKYYGDVYKVAGNKVMALMFYNGSAGTYLPYIADFENSYFKKVYDTKTIVSGTFKDSYGEWMYAAAPLIDMTGEVVAVLEVGTDLSSYEEYKWEINKEIIFNMLTLLVILILFLIEMTIFKSLHNENVSPKITMNNKIMMIRPLSFITMLGYSMSMAFIPLFAQQLYVPFFNIPQNVVIGLPISFEMIFIAVSSLFAGTLAERNGWRPIFIFGLFLMTTGSVFSAISWDPASLIVARSICGFGFGLTQTSGYMYVLNEDKSKQSNAIANLGAGGYAGLTCGVVIGGTIAEKIGFSNVFYIIAVIIVIAAIFALKMTINIKQDKVVKKKTKSKSVLNFLKNKYVILFFIMLYIPVSICSMFLVYFFPIFAETTGYNSDDIGRIFMIYGICVIYFGPILTRFLSGKFGDKFSTILYVLLNIFGLAIFAFNVSITSAIIAILLMGLAEGFGITVALNYLVSLPASKKVGEGITLGFYELMENFGQTIGPIIFGLLILLGYSTGVGAIAICSFVLLILFIVLTAKEKHIDFENDLSKKKIKSKNQ